MPNTYLVSVKGVSFSNSDGVERQAIIKELSAGQAMRLEAEPMNPTDRWAVAVKTCGGDQIGFLPSDARDASTLLRGEPIEAHIAKLTGGTNWFNRAILRKQSIGVVLRIVKEEPDWKRSSRFSEKASPLDEKVENALALERSGESEASEHLFREVIEEIRKLTRTDRFASAHRRKTSPVDRLSLLLEKQKRYEDAAEVIVTFFQEYDPVQPTKAERERLEKRLARLKKKMGS